MAPQSTTITVTLHWPGKTGTRSANIICEDSPPSDLIPILAVGCGLPDRDTQGGVIPYTLRLGMSSGAALQADIAISTQGVCDGSHLWLGPPRGSALGMRHCLLTLPDASMIVVPPAGLVLTRRWLLRAFALLHPEAYERELRLLSAGRSDYRFVSNQPHCRIMPAAANDWHVTTERDDVATLLNGVPLLPHRPTHLADGHAIQLGEGGPALAVALI